ncbi:Os08g0530801, partial [Oryza sativa Japonica Group]
SGGERGGEAAVVHAAEHVAVIPLHGEGVIHLPIAALLVLEQQRRVVERGELDEPEVPVPENAPLGDRRGVVREVAPAAAGDDEDGAVHGAGVAAPLAGDALALVHRARPLVVVDVAEEGDVDAVALPQPLQALPPFGLLEGALVGVPPVGGVAQHAVRREDEPRLVLPVHRRQALLDELVLVGTLPPVVLRVRDAEPEHPVVHLVPKLARFSAG